MVAIQQLLQFGVSERLVVILDGFEAGEKRQMSIYALGSSVELTHFSCPQSARPTSSH